MTAGSCDNSPKQNFSQIKTVTPPPSKKKTGHCIFKTRGKSFIFLTLKAGGNTQEIANFEHETFSL